MELSDLIGKKVGRLLILEKYKQKDNKRIFYKCLCNCGIETLVMRHNLINETTRSCGCLSKERKTKHGLYGTQEYKNIYQRRRRDFKKLYMQLWTKDKDFLLKRLYTSCILCGSQERLCVDHVWPLSKGFGLSERNAVILCNKCNAKKSNKTLKELPVYVSLKILEKVIEFQKCYEHYNLIRYYA